MMMAVSRQLPQCWADQAGALLAGGGASDPLPSAGRSDGPDPRVRRNRPPVGGTVAAVQDEPDGRATNRQRHRADSDGRLPPFTRTDSPGRSVINILPSNATTDGLFDADLIGRMKPTAMFYNIGRGTTVVQAALQTALERNAIAGVYLDVTDPEPLPPDHPLWRLPNCWITPHTAGGHADEFERIIRHFLEELASI